MSKCFQELQADGSVDTGARSVNTHRRTAPNRGRLFSWRPSWLGLLHLVAISVIVLGVWATANDRLNLASWRIPVSFRDDDPLMLAWFQAASEFDYVPFADRTINRLGAPYTANWNDYPMYESVVTFLIGMLARWTDLITASNLAMVGALVVSAVSFFACCRVLRWRREWSAAGALLFAFTYYHIGSGLGHLLLCYDHTVPLAVMCAWLLTASKSLRLGDRVFWLSAGSALLLGIGNPYNLGMWLQLLFFGFALRFLLLRRKADLVVGGVLLAITALGFLAVNANMMWYQIVHGKNQEALWRGYHQLEIFALKPIELILPPPEHRLAWWGDISRNYLMNAWMKGEMFSPYLGVVGLGALLWLIIEFALRVLNLRKIPRRLPSYAPLCAWVMAYSAIGGVNCMLGLFFGLMYFRGSNRYSIFISAIALFFLVSRMSRLTRRWNRAASYAVASAVAVVGILDQLPRRSKDDTWACARVVQNDRAFGRRLEEKLPHGAMVFQMPVMIFTEADPVGQCQPYEHLRPYLWTKHLRFSFGSVKGRPREEWQAQVADLPADQLVKELQRYGFAGLYFNRKAYQDRAEGKLKELMKCGKADLIEDDAREQVCVVLAPSPDPSLPNSDAAAQIAYKSGWVWEEPSPDGSRHWSGGDASLYFVNEAPKDSSFHMTGVVTGWIDQQVEVQLQGETLGSQFLKGKQGWILDLHLRARPGRNYLYFRSDAKPQPPPGRPQGIRVALGVVNLRIVRESPPERRLKAAR